MEIGPLDQSGKVPAGTDRAKQAQRSAEYEPKEAADSVEISLKARALLAQAADTSRAEERPGSERLEMIRDKVASGHYDRPEIIEAVAQKLADLMY